jgi:D-Tyr-tRNAtyr deacylase
MKTTKLLFILSIILFQTGLNAQNLFDKYEDYDDVSSVIVTDEMFKLFKDIEPESDEAKEEMQVLSSLTGLKVFSTEDNKISAEILKDADGYISSNHMTELIRINNEGTKVKFYIVKGDKPHFAKELIMVLVEKKDGKTNTVVMIVSGDIDLKKLSKLNSKVKIIDGKYLKEVEAHENN